ncbi:MAG: NitT/TauT family transport system substrate-binding protein [Streptosporangiaceae bacterium]|jgi:NitT/TauT family transport system substrate-binding protein|nr:NitT/TauT family transport system substrate-binding protein [Streptosporangiaceae bacterium]
MRVTSGGRGGRRPLRHTLAVIMIAGTAVAAACSSTATATKSAGPEKRDLVVAAVPGEGAAGLYIAQEKGLFSKQGLHLTIQTVTSSSTVIPAMLHGSVDVASGQYTSYITADAAGIAKMRILAAGYSLGPHVQEVIVPAHSDIRTLAGLKGKTIAVNAPNSETTDLLYTALSSYGITPGQVHLAVIPFPAMSAALVAGRVNAAYEIEPYLTEAVKQHGVQELADIDSGATQDFPIAGYGVLASWAAKYPRTAAAFVKVIKQANAIAATNLTVLQQAFTTQLHLSRDITGVMATGTFPTTADAVQLQRVADLMLQYGQLKKRFSVKSITGT